MRTRTTAIYLAVALACLAHGSSAEAQLREVYSDRISKTLPLAEGGVVFIDTFVGSITVSGGTEDEIVVEATSKIEAAQGVDVRQVRRGLGVRFEGTSARQTIKSIGLVNTRKIATRIDYDVKLPAGASVNLIGGLGEHFDVEGISGKVYVRSIRGRISVDRVSGPVYVDSVNSDVFVTYRVQPTAGGEIKSTNGNIEVRVPENAKVRWLAQTLKGDIMTGGLDSLAGELFDAGGQKTYRAVLNKAKGPQISVLSVTGRAYLLPTENPRTLAASVLPAEQQGPQKDDMGSDLRQIVTSLLVQPPSARSFFIQKGRQAGNLDLTVGLGANVFYAQVDGDANVTSHGGEVVIGRVGGTCSIDSKGGGVNLGDVQGRMNATTAAGDVLVRFAREGGRLETGGGSIYVLYAGDTMTLESGGGDLTVRQAAGGLTARTKSGDIAVATDPKPKDEAPISLTTGGGNIVFEVAPSRGFDLDAEIETDAESAYRIESSFSGLTTVREKSGNRVKIRARGQINGGGTRVTLRAADGNITVGRLPDNRVVFVQ